MNFESIPSPTDVMRAITESLQNPTIIAEILLVVLIVILLGMLIAEIFTERRHFKVFMPQFVDDLREKEDTVEVLQNSGLLKRQRDGLIELICHPQISNEDRESLAASICFKEQERYDRRVKVTDYIAKIGPMLGLMGTLIPLGPGLVALGRGDTVTLSDSLLVAFDTTVLGLVIALFALLISTIRKFWYRKYTSIFESAVECVLEKAADNHDFGIVRKSAEIDDKKSKSKKKVSKEKDNPKKPSSKKSSSNVAPRNTSKSL